MKAPAQSPHRTQLPRSPSPKPLSLTTHLQDPTDRGKAKSTAPQRAQPHNSVGCQRAVCLEARRSQDETNAAQALATSRARGCPARVAAAALQGKAGASCILRAGAEPCCPSANSSVSAARSGPCKGRKEREKRKNPDKSTINGWGFVGECCRTPQCSLGHLLKKALGGQNGQNRAGGCPGPGLPFQTLLGSPSTGRTQQQLKHGPEAHAAPRAGDVKLTQHLKARWALFLYRPPTKHRIQRAADAGAASCPGFSPP